MDEDDTVPAAPSVASSVQTEVTSLTSEIPAVAAATAVTVSDVEIDGPVLNAEQVALLRESAATANQLASDSSSPSTPLIRVIVAPGTDSPGNLEGFGRGAADGTWVTVERREAPDERTDAASLWAANLLAGAVAALPAGPQIFGIQHFVIGGGGEPEFAGAGVTSMQPLQSGTGWEQIAAAVQERAQNHALITAIEVRGGDIGGPVLVLSMQSDDPRTLVARRDEIVRALLPVEERAPLAGLRIEVRDAGGTPVYTWVTATRAGATSTWFAPGYDDHDFQANHG